MAFTTTSIRALAALLAFASMACTAPVAEPGLPLELIKSYLQTRDVQSPVSGLPGCSISDPGQPDNQDPTWAVGQSNYTDGEGTYIGSDCDNHQGGSSHCWTDYFLVGTAESYRNWYNVMGDIQCDGSCSQSTADISQNCTTSSWTVSETMSTSFDVLFANIGFSLSIQEGQTYQSCSSKTNTNVCTWSDTSCHSIWAAQGIKTAYGYTRRRCNSPAGGPGINMPWQPVSDGDCYTRGMMDFSIPLADSSAVTCDGTCDAGYNPGALPSVNGSLQPWSS